jgi:hypothetical protein
LNQPWIKETVKCKNANVVGTRIVVSRLPPVPKFPTRNIAQKKSASEPEKESGTGRSWNQMKITERPAEMPRRIGERKILIIGNSIEPAKKIMYKRIGSNSGQETENGNWSILATGLQRQTSQLWK